MDGGLARLKQLERRLTGAGAASCLNDIEGLYRFCESADLRAVAEALQAIGRVLAHHRARARAEAAPCAAGDSEPLLEWLAGHARAYHAVLVRLAASGNARAQVCAVRLAMDSIRGEAEEGREASRGAAGAAVDPRLLPPPPEARVQELLSEVLLADSWSDYVARCLMGDFARPFVDVRHYLLSHLRICAEQAGREPAADRPGAADPAQKRRRVATFADSMRDRGRTPAELFARLFALLGEAPEPAPPADGGNGALGLAAEEEETECRVLIPTGRPVGFFLREYPRLFQDAWLRLLALPAPLEQCKPLFQFLPSHVMPFLSKPLMLADFYLRAFSGASAEVSVLSLSGLLLLLTKYGLGDPDTLSASASEFYAKLYDLVRPETLRLRRRARFQRLLAASLSSGLLPARFAAAFAKRCMRTAVLCQDSGSVMWLLSVAYTLIQRHHSHCEFLIHRRPEKAGGEEAPSTLQEDPFDAGAELPAAVESVAGSSLWELQLLRRHHSPAVATLTKLFLKPFFRPTAKKLDLELMLEQSTARLYMQALKAGERQASRWKFRGETCPLAFKVQDDEEANRVAGWASALSTEQRRIGAGK